MATMACVCSHVVVAKQLMKVTTMDYEFLQTPIGRLLLVGDEAGLRQIEFPSADQDAHIEPEWRRDARHLDVAMEQLRAYFAGNRLMFDVLLAARGTDFRKKVWSELSRIPYAETITYGELARRIDAPRASRAVGAANGVNPLPIIVPCHRVIGANGKLTGFSGGLSIKQWLLDHERRFAPRPTLALSA